MNLLSEGREGDVVGPGAVDVHVSAAQPLLPQPETATQGQAALIVGAHVDLHAVQPHRPQQVVQDEGHRQAHDPPALPGRADPVADLGAARGPPGDRVDGDLAGEGAVDLDDVIARAVRALAQITQQAAVVQYPSLQRVSLRHIELIPSGAGRVILVIITEAGRVEQRTLALARDVDAEDLASLGRCLNAELTGLRLADLALPLASLAEAAPARLHEVLDVVGTAITEALRADAEERLVMAGAAHLSRHSVDFARSISPVLDALEEQVVLLRLLAAMQDGVSVSIGEENPYEELSEASVVSSTYDVAEQSVARVGVIGPTRMDYPGTMAAVYAISRYLSDILSNR